jgi:cytochrome b involved in lipid metabolism
LGIIFLFKTQKKTQNFTSLYSFLQFQNNIYPSTKPMAPKELQVFQAEEVRKHASEGDLWIIIDGSVYDMSVFIDMHPGGVFPILEYAGKDATEAFYGMHRQEVLFKYDRYKIGTVAGVEPQITLNVPGTISMVPYAELSAWQGYKSPYYK